MSDFLTPAKIMEQSRAGMGGTKDMVSVVPLEKASSPEKNRAASKEYAVTLRNMKIVFSYKAMIEDLEERLEVKEIVGQGFVTEWKREEKMFEHFPLEADKRNFLENERIEVYSKDRASVKEKRERRIAVEEELNRGEKEMIARRIIERDMMVKTKKHYDLVALGLTYDFIDQQINQNGLGSTFEGEAREFLYHVGWNEDFIAHYDERRIKVDRVREIMAMSQYGKHFSELLSDSKERKIILAIDTDDFIENIQGEDKIIEKKWKKLKKEVEEGGVISNDEYNSLNILIQNELNKRAKGIFKGEFTELSDEDKRLCLVNTDEILTFYEIMEWMFNYQVKNDSGEETGNTLRSLYGVSTSLWEKAGFVEITGPKALADLQMEAIFSYGIGLTPPIFNLAQINQYKTKGFGRGNKFNPKAFLAFHGSKFVDREGKITGEFGGLVEMCKGDPMFEVKWEEGYYKELWDERKGEWLKDTGGGKVPFKNWLAGKYGILSGDYFKFAQEARVNGWRLAAEAVYVKMMAEQIRLHLDSAEDIRKAKEEIGRYLDQAKKDGNLSHLGVPILKRISAKEEKTALKDIIMIIQPWKLLNEKKNVEYKEALNHIVFSKVGRWLFLTKHRLLFDKTVSGVTGSVGVISSLIGLTTFALSPSVLTSIWPISSIALTAVPAGLNFLIDKYIILSSSSFEKRMEKIEEKKALKELALEGKDFPGNIWDMLHPEKQAAEILKPMSI